MTTYESICRMNKDLGRSAEMTIPAAEAAIRLAMDAESIISGTPRVIYAVTLMIPERVA